MKNYKALKSRLSGCRVIAQETHAIVVAVLKLKYLSFFWNTMWVLLLKEHSFRFFSSELYSFFSIAVWSLYSTIDLVSGKSMTVNPFHRMGSVSASILHILCTTESSWITLLSNYIIAICNGYYPTIGTQECSRLIIISSEMSMLIMHYKINNQDIKVMLSRGVIEK